MIQIKRDFSQPEPFLSNGLLPPFERGNQPPAQVDRDPFPAENIHTLNTALSCAMQDCPPADELELALKLMRYVCGELRRGDRCGFVSGASVLNAGEGVTCAAFTKLLVALLRASSIPAREASFGGLTTNTGHTVCEGWIDERWICMDPYYGLLFLSTPFWQPQALLSFQALVNHPGRHWHLFKILQRPWQGRNCQTISKRPEPIEADYVADVVPDIATFYKEMVAIAYPVTYRATATCFPLLADLRQRLRYELTAWTPQQDATRRYLGLGPRNGSRSLGFAFMNLLWLLTAGPALVRVTIAFSDQSPPLQCLPLADLRVVEHTMVSANQMRFTLRTISDQAMALLYAPDSFGVLAGVVVEVLDEK